MIIIMKLELFGEHKIFCYEEWLSQQEKDTYNSEVKAYLGDKIKGSEVKDLIDIIMSKNQENIGKSGKFISIKAGNIREYSD